MPREKLFDGQVIGNRKALTFSDATSEFALFNSSNLQIGTNGAANGAQVLIGTAIGSPSYVGRDVFFGVSPTPGHSGLILNRDSNKYLEFLV